MNYFTFTQLLFIILIELNDYLFETFIHYIISYEYITHYNNKKKQ